MLKFFAGSSAFIMIMGLFFPTARAQHPVIESHQMDVNLLQSFYFPQRIKMIRGERSYDQSLETLSQRELKNYEYNWLRLIDFYPDVRLDSVFFFEVPADEVHNISKMTLNVNFQGWDAERQLWRFKIFNFKNRQWQMIGDNSGIIPWKWSLLQFEIPGNPGDYLDRRSRLRVRFQSPTSFENSFLDYFAIHAEHKDAIPDPRTETYLYGVTLDSIDNVDETLKSLNNLPKKMTVRVVFDEYMPPEYYQKAVEKISKNHFVLGGLLDSFYFRLYPLEAYKQRVLDYLDAMQGQVHAWEIGNEINGEWLGEHTVEKIEMAFDLVKSAEQLTALTFYYNEDCWAKPEHEFFRWIQENISQKLRAGLDYVFVSFYEDDCNQIQPNWPEIFGRLATLFPRSKIGFGEIGTIHKEKKVPYLQKYYNLKIDQEHFVGGYFWWYFRQDMVPMENNPLWESLRQVIE